MKIFEVVYWLAKEELPNKKFTSVLDMIKNVTDVDLKRQFPYTSKEIERELFLFVGILTDEVTDISVTQQLVTLIQYFDRQKCTIDTKFLAVGNTSKGSTSADAPQITRVLVSQLDKWDWKYKICAALFLTVHRFIISRLELEMV